LKRHWWQIALFVALCSAAAIFISLRMTPLYEATATVEVDYQQPTGIIGQDAEKPLPANDSDEYLGTQVKLVESDDVLRPVAMKYDLLAVERQVKGVNPAADDRVKKAPIVLKRLKVSRQVSTQLLLITYRAPSAELAAAAANEIANSYVAKIYELRSRSLEATSHFMEGQIQELKAKMDASNQRLTDVETEMGVINPEERTSVLSARLLQLNTDYTNAQAERMQKEASEDAAKTNTLEAAQVSTQGEEIKKIREQLSAEREVFAAVRATYGPNHPEYRKSEQKVEELTRQLDEAKNNAARRIGTDYQESVQREHLLEKRMAETKAEYDRANTHLAGYEQIKREADDDRAMYGEMLRKVRESSINAAFQNRNIRVADYARPPARPFSPNVPMNLALTMFSSTLLAVGGVMAMDATDNTLRNGPQASRVLGVSVLGTLPAVRDPNARTPAQRATLLLGEERPARDRKDLMAYGEAIRKLRNAILFSRNSTGIHTVLITSAMQGEGKSVTAADLALSMAQLRRKTLLIDADLRQPVLHSRFNLETAAGLGNVLARTAGWQTAVMDVPDVPDLQILPAGNASILPADLIGPAFQDLLIDLKRHYDLVVVDAPPVLPFAEPVQIASSVDAVVLVAEAGRTTAAAVDAVMSSLEWAGAQVLGVVLNRVQRSDEGADYGRGYFNGRGDYGAHRAPAPPGAQG
jgi:capsular exopolysaccharide synthesis family protein